VVALESAPKHAKNVIPIPREGVSRDRWHNSAPCARDWTMPRTPASSLSASPLESTARIWYPRFCAAVFAREIINV
jgi:hypothetical protein